MDVLVAARRSPVAARAFAAFPGIALPALAFETGSYDVRFGGAEVIRDRYLSTSRPLLLVATAAALVGRGSRSGVVVGATAFFAMTVAFAGFPRVARRRVDSAESVLNGVIRDLSPGLPPGVFVAAGSARHRCDLPRRSCAFRGRR